MSALMTHNFKELPYIEQIQRNETHLLGEFVKDLDLDDPDVKWALSERVADIISDGEGQHMAELVD